MQLHRRRHPEFDEARVYEYPSHLREAIEGMPCAPGVYIFHGTEGDLPLYIGKSVNLRSRLLAHLRNPDEARLLRRPCESAMSAPPVRSAHCCSKRA